MRLFARDWMDDGFRTFKPKTFRWYLYQYNDDDYQGDRRRSWTIHLAGRGFQFTVWEPERR